MRLFKLLFILLPLCSFGQITQQRSTTLKTNSSAVSFTSEHTPHTVTTTTSDGKSLTDSVRSVAFIIGQSLAGCRGDSVEVNDTINGIFVYHDDSAKFKTLIAGVNNCPSDYYPARHAGFLIELAPLIKGTNLAKHFIKYGIGSSDIDEWTNTHINTVWNSFADPAGQNAIDSGFLYNYQVAIWVHGQSAAQTTTEADEYYSKLNTFFGSFWGRYGKVPVIMTNLGWWSDRDGMPQWDRVNTSIYKFAADHDNVHVISLDSISFDTDSTHLDSLGNAQLADSIRTVWERQVNKWQEGMNYHVYKDTLKTFGDEYDMWDLDGTDEYFSINNSADFKTGSSTADSSFSVAMWVNIDDATSFRMMGDAHFKNNPSLDSMVWYMFTGGDDKLYTRCYDQNHDNYIGQKSNGTLTSYQDNLALITFTYSGSGTNAGIKQYVNDAVFFSANNSAGSYTAMSDYNQTLVIGKVYSTTGSSSPGYANGEFGPVMFVNKELSLTEVQEAYHKGCPIKDHTKYSFKDNIKAFWGGNSTGTTWTDDAGNNDATGVNVEEADKSTIKCK